MSTEYGAPDAHDQSTNPALTQAANARQKRAVNGCSIGCLSLVLVLLLLIWAYGTLVSSSPF